ncbi:hypothetical protein [Streptomyces sp. SM12]|uniref:hypothetical protein n=1 Tax=Streptomyces sp. SM12 TaxID=1071602 RepID=UPI0011B073F6|nr:hypothetical protein [Streptomyces sp. SM12]
MDEGTVAVIAAGCGLLGSLLGAAFTAWATKAGADKSADAVRGQAYDQAANEHAHWLRQQRLSACEGFLDAWDECTRRRKELARPAEEGQHRPHHAELHQAATRMLERARRISILGPDEVAKSAQSISDATMENIEKEDRFGRYIVTAAARIREQGSHIRELSPDLKFEQLEQVLTHAGDLEKMQELYSIEDLERIVESVDRSMAESEEWLRRMAIFGELGDEINNEGARFLEDFKHNIQVTEENRAVFVLTVRNSIATPPTRNP